jgi:DNA-binding transcriptional LysR family regulator
VLLRRDTHRMSMTETGRRLLSDATAMLAHAEVADRRLREDHTTLSGHLRLFATMDLGTWIVTPLVSQFLQANPKVSATLALNNRPLQMIEEGCDVGVLPGKITDESVIARPAGMISLHLTAAPVLVRSRPQVKALADLKSWPWISVAGSQFWSNNEITLFRRDGAGQTLRFSPILVSEGITSIREAVRDGLGVALLPDWLIKDELDSGDLVQVLPKWKGKELPIHVVYAGQRVLPTRVSAFIDFAVSYLAKARKDDQREGGG